MEVIQDQINYSTVFKCVYDGDYFISVRKSNLIIYKRLDFLGRVICTIQNRSQEYFPSHKLVVALDLTPANSSVICRTIPNHSYLNQICFTDQYNGQFRFVRVQTTMHSPNFSSSNTSPFHRLFMGAHYSSMFSSGLFKIFITFAAR